MPSPDVDVIVAGAGAAGLAASIAAADGGASVLLLEAKETFREGSNTAMSTSMIPAGGSRWQAEAGIDDSPDLLYADLMSKTKGKADPVVARALADVAPRLVVWLADTCDVPLELVTDISYPGNSRHRHHSVPERAGRVLHGHLLRAAAARSNITLVVPSRLAGIEATNTGWRAATKRPDGTEESVDTRAVVFATNGFGANEELVRRHVPEIADGLYFGGDGSTGDALMIGETIGADTGYLGAYQGHGSVATPHGVLLTWTTMMNGGILVNAEAQRFQNETIGYSESAVNVLGQPGRIAWAVYDQFVHDRALPFKDYRDLVEMEGVRWADDVAGVAAIIGCRQDHASRTLSEAARYAAGGDDPLGRTDWAHTLEPPFALVKVTGALFHTQGGLQVDERASVLRDGTPIAGVFAAGGAAVGVSGDSAYGYVSGNGLLSALGLGYLAGNAVAADLTD
ncbi:MAG: FAD-dependent oxidoreductase [Acidimicrobiia bacterium]|nr:MAG: FAD-dependent oxidoreductase [Acidimicrobiia bacterium]